jgi:tRNA U34 5-carboxymethylaminomethyl modifying GTPase MnmE/TrmE
MKEKLDKMICLMEQSDILEEQVRRTKELRLRVSQNELIVSVIGQFKRGKSSLINAMIGDRLLPVGIIPLTTVITEIRYGNQFKAVARFKDETEREIGRGELPDYISEQKNQENHKNVAAVKLWVPSEPFGSDVTIVDTPGVASVHQHNTDTSFAYIEKSDAVLFLLSVDSPVSEAERQFLLKTREHAPKFYFAVNKIDTISRIDQAEFIAYCRSVLSHAIGFDVLLYPLSAETGEGVPEMMRKISSDIRASHDMLLTASVALKLNNIIRQAKSKIELFLKAVAIPAEELESKISQIKSKQRALETLNDEVQILTKKQTERLVDHIEEHLGEMLPEALAAIQAKAQQRYENMKSLPSKQFGQDIAIALESLLRDEIRRLNDAGLTMLQEGYAGIVGVLNKKAADIAQYISGMMMESFGVEYPISAREYPVSDRDDYFIRLSHDGSILLDTSNLTHFLPRARANAVIFKRALQRAADDLERNKNNMLYNYRYKVQESLRTLYGEFSSDIAEMNSELTQLLAHIERDHIASNKELDNTRSRYWEIARQLDPIFNDAHGL